jgi:hypothetical protein
MKPKQHYSSIILLGLFLSSSHGGKAQTTAVGFTPNSTAVEDNAADAFGNPHASLCLGWEFTVNRPITVTSLGWYYNPGFDASQPFDSVAIGTTLSGATQWTDSHETGIFEVVPGVGGSQETGLLLTEATISSSAARVGNFLYADLPSASTPSLFPGKLYVISGVSGAVDPYALSVQDASTFDSIGLNVDPAITYIQDRFSVGGSLSYPNLTDPISEPGFWGGNFRFTSTPEPGGIATSLILGGLGLVGLRYRKAQVLRRARRSSKTDI